MHISEYDLEYLKKVKALGDNNVFIGGSIILNILGIVRNIGDIDVILDNPSEEQLDLINEYIKLRRADFKEGGDKYELDFVRKRDDEVFDKDITFKGFPVASLGSLVRFKKYRGTEQDYQDLNSLMRLILESNNEDINKEGSILAILKDVNYARKQ